MINIKIIKNILSVVVVLLSAYSLLTSDFTYQNVTLFFVGLLLGVIGIEERKKAGSQRWGLLPFVAAIIIGLVLIHSVILFIA